MKKIAVILLALLLLAGCNKNNTRQLDEERFETYKILYKNILTEENKLTKSQNYDIELVVNKIGDDLYRYDVIIDNPRVVMYAVKALAVVDDLSDEINTEIMMPSIGILDENRKNMMPYFVNAEKEFVDGIILSLTTNSPQARVGVMVEYIDSSRINSNREYLTLYAAYTPEEVTPNE